MLQSVNIRLPQPVFERLQRVAQREQRSIVDTVDALVVQAEPFPSLRDEVEREMFALASFPNEVLVLLAQHPVAVESQMELADLNDKAQRHGNLTEKDEERRAELLEAYQQGILRRSYLDNVRLHGCSIVRAILGLSNRKSALYRKISLKSNLP